MEQACPARPLPHHVQQLSVSFNDQGNGDPADDVIEATLTLCGKVATRSAYEISLDARPPLFSDTDRNGDGVTNRRDFCAQTRDTFSAWIGGRSTGAGTATLVPGTGQAPDAVRFGVPVDPSLPRDGTATVYLWAETRLVGAIPVPPFTFVNGRLLVDRLPVPNVTDGCALPQTGAEVLAMPVTAPASTSKLVFITSTTFNGNLGGATGGDAICQTRAAAAGLSGTFKAWLSDTTTSPSTRFTRSSVPYKLANGTTIAADWADFTDYDPSVGGDLLLAPINVTEFGTPHPQFNVSVWTATYPDGRYDPTSDDPVFASCNNWTSNTNSSAANATGLSEATDRNWTFFGGGSCDRALALYCFQQ